MYNAYFIVIIFFHFLNKLKSIQSIPTAKERKEILFIFG
jgi:hypothetical protein